MHRTRSGTTQIGTVEPKYKPYFMHRTRSGTTQIGTVEPSPHQSLGQIPMHQPGDE